MKVLCKIIAGSHLFGTNTEKSDLDYKGVFIPDADDILMSSYKHTVCTSTNTVRNTKNSSEDVDLEMYSLKKFFDMIFAANNHALEILFAPDNMIIETSPTRKCMFVSTKVISFSLLILISFLPNQ